MGEGCAERILRAREAGQVVINEVDVAPLIEAELDRRYPDRVKMRPEEPDGFREAWRVLDELWDATVARARRLTPAQLNEGVNGEWSFIETLRHLLYATDCWIGRAILGDPSPWHRLDWPPDDDDWPTFPLEVPWAFATPKGAARKRASAVDAIRNDTRFMR